MEKVKNLLPVNWALLSNPINWVIVWLMVSIGLLGLVYVYQSTDTTQQDD